MIHGCVMTLTQGLTSRSKSQCTYTRNPCPSHNSSLPSSIYIIFHTIVIHNSSACHDLDPRSYLQGQGHNAHIPEIRIRDNSSLTCWIWIIFRAIIIHDSRVCHDLDPKSYLQGQGHIAHIPEIRIRAITLYCQIWLGWYFTYLLSMTQGLLWPGGGGGGGVGICPVMTCLFYLFIYLFILFIFSCSRQRVEFIGWFVLFLTDMIFAHCHYTSLNHYLQIFRNH